MQELGNFFIGKSFGRKKQKENALRSLLERFDQVGGYSGPGTIGIVFANKD